jgi:nitroreductase
LVEASNDQGYQKAYLESASAVIENMLLTATALVLGGCWLVSPLEDEKYLRRVLCKNIFEGKVMT